MNVAAPEPAAFCRPELPEAVAEITPSAVVTPTVSASAVIVAGMPLAAWSHAVMSAVDAKQISTAVLAAAVALVTSVNLAFCV